MYGNKTGSARITLTFRCIRANTVEGEKQ